MYHCEEDLEDAASTIFSFVFCINSPILQSLATAAGRKRGRRLNVEHAAEEPTSFIAEPPKNSSSLQASAIEARRRGPSGDLPTPLTHAAE